MRRYTVKCSRDKGKTWIPWATYRTLSAAQNAVERLIGAGWSAYVLIHS